MSGSKDGFFRKGIKRLIEARTREAERYVAGMLSHMDEESLRARGLTRKDFDY